MNANPNVVMIATLVSDNSRAAILTVLLDGRYHPASELAYMAGIKPQTASFHLSKMVEANIVTVEKQGRHRYFGMKNQEVAEVLESFLSISPPVEVKSLKQASEDKALRSARTCYDHIAGGLGIKLVQSLIVMGVLIQGDKEFLVTDKGKDFFSAFEMDIEKVKKNRRAFAIKCLDWSERKHHLAGALGNALLVRLLELNWVQRLPKTRAIKVTLQGKRGLKDIFNIEV